MSENRKLFDREIPTVISGSKRLAIGSPTELAENVTLDGFKNWLGLGSGSVKTRIFEIGAWNMDVTQAVFVNVYTGTTFLGFLRIPLVKIRGVKVIIRNDADTMYADFLSVHNGTALTVPQIQILEFTFIGTSTVVNLQRRTGGFFDSASYSKLQNPDSTAYNRGWVIVDYIE